jgi:protease-4
VAEAGRLARLGKDYPVRYVELPQGGFERFLMGLSQSASVHVLQSFGVRLPEWVAQLPAKAPELQLLRHAKAGTPNIYADCLCRPR